MPLNTKQTNKQTVFLAGLLCLVLQFKFCDWKEYLLEKLTGSKTLPSNFQAKIVNSVKRCPLKEGMKLEVIDKLCLSTMSVATVEEVIGGRIKLRYLWSEVINAFCVVILCLFTNLFACI